MLDRFIPTPRLLEVDEAEVGAAQDAVWHAVRDGDLAQSPLIRALFLLRTLPERLTGHRPQLALRLSEMKSSVEQPGFQILAEDAPHEVVVGAIGQVWHLDIPFVHTAPEQYADFEQAGFVKVAWSVALTARGQHSTHVRFELRVDATDDEAWRKFQTYFRVIGPASHFIRRSVLSTLVRTLGAPEAQDNERCLPGDELLAEAGGQVTDAITIAAPAQRIWPWLLQLGCRRGGFYSYDLLDNGNQRSARELHPDLMQLCVGQRIPAAPDSEDGFEVLQVQEPHVLVLGGLYDIDANAQLPFSGERPARFWHVTWAFVLEPLGADSTRLLVRARVAYPPSQRLHATWIRPVHRFMQRRMLLNLAERAEGKTPRDDYRDVLQGVGGAALMLGGILTPFLRKSRLHWGLSEEDANRTLPGDVWVAQPRWVWTHAIEVQAPASKVWPWLAQIGVGRAGFYSFQWLENLVGCEVRNAETVHPEWQLTVGDELRLHPSAPPLRIELLEPGQFFVAVGAADEVARAASKPWSMASWLLLIEPLDDQRCRVISRFRTDFSDDLLTRLTVGPTLLEPIGFAMDRRMLQGIKQRAEAAVTN